MRHAWLIACAALLAVSACNKAAPEADKKGDADTAGVHLSAEEIKSLGVIIMPASPARYSRSVNGYGVVTALDTLAQSDADFATAAAAAAQSQAAAARARSLSTGEEAAVSREVVETAQSKAAVDQAALALARRKADAAFGLNAPWRDPAARQAIMARLASGRTVLVRITFPLGAITNGTPQNLKIARLGDGAKSWGVSSIWDAPADPAIPGRGFYALVDGSDLAQNEHVTATMPVGAAESGVTVPANALVYGDSQAWAYVEAKPGTFQRVPVDTGKPMGDGYFLPGSAGVDPGKPMVTSGAGLLLAHELNPSTDAGD
jgi:multidrug efflux system membrane fusion protein